jgi:hypothetical protein
MFSCVTGRQKLTIHGAPGTEIYKVGRNEELEKIGTIDESGKTKISTSRRRYLSYLIAKDFNTNKLRPFGIDYEYSSLQGQIILTSVPTLGLGALFYAEYLSSDQNLNCYQYLKHQHIDPYIPNAEYANTGERRPLLGTRTKQTSTAESSSTSRLLRSDYAKQAEGDYTGNGKLILDGETIENYSNMKITVERAGRNTVAVNVLVDGTDAIFDTPINYSVEKTNSGKFILTSDDDASSTITIDSNKQANYVNPNVKIDGETYKLQITAK